MGNQDRRVQITTDRSPTSSPSSTTAEGEGRTAQAVSPVLKQICHAISGGGSGNLNQLA
jgi:hypothetical protein